MIRWIFLGAVAFALLATGVSCGDDDAASGAKADSMATIEATQDATSSTDNQPDDESDNQPSQSATSGGAGTLTLGDDVIELASARCFLQEQDVAGSPGKILFTAQGFGATTDGEDFVLDVSRYDEDSLFTGDDIQVDVGSPFGADFFSWNGSADLGTIELDGSTLRAEGLTFRHSEDGTELTGAFELSC